MTFGGGFGCPLFIFSPKRRKRRYNDIIDFLCGADMKNYEKVPVFARIEKGKTVCVCHAANKKCGNNCTAEALLRDKFKGWQGTMRHDRYGR